jgi:hypothetical protein
MNFEQVLDIVPYQNFKDPPLPHTHSKLVSKKPGLGWQNFFKIQIPRLGSFFFFQNSKYPLTIAPNPKP